MAAIMAGHGGSIGVPCNHPLPGRFADASCAHRTAWFAVRARRGAGRVHAPTFVTFTSLVTGLLGATGSRTVTGMWSAAGAALDVVVATTRCSTATAPGPTGWLAARRLREGP